VASRFSIHIETYLGFCRFHFARPRLAASSSVLATIGSGGTAGRVRTATRLSVFSHVAGHVSRTTGLCFSCFLATRAVGHCAANLFRGPCVRR
jgi:hypothetical protein